ncbi:polymer-forming cytoskeletal protein [Microbacterium sp. Leaf179]|uniref:polymer-forming cytoskeletal protein n=1 Tax=Microbacterium sp. Leaf179 TaxID=1736288 RepID=UPI0006FB02D2|nr:polymer-forming cytoskeletal protein [Microbacterium sp. Leaf179]KQR88745.1 hypothetical protein ASF96_02960 [Microbacterium sp. Leaf179]
MVDDLSDFWGELRRLRHDVDRLQVATPLQSASIGSGGIRVYNGGYIKIENGGLEVSGYAQISGALRGDGTIDWTGDVDFSGPVEITGTLDVTAETRLRGDTTIEGRTRLLSELEVEGKISAGDMTMDPGVSGGALTFANGAQVFTDADTIQVFKGNAVVQVSGSYARLQYGGNVLQIDADGVRVSPGVVGIAAEGEATPLGTTSAGRLRRMPAAPS